MLLDLKWPWKFLQKGSNPNFIESVDNKIDKDSKISRLENEEMVYSSDKKRHLGQIFMTFQGGKSHLVLL